MKSAGILLLSIATLTGCETVTVQNQELWLRHREEVDRIELLVLYDGIGGPRSATASVEPLLDGRRRFALFWGSSIDLDAFEERELTDEDRELLAGVTVESFQTFLNEDDKLSFFQLIHIRDAERVVRRLNRIVLEGMSVAPEVASQPEVERARAWREFAHEGLDLFALRDTQLVYRYPVTEDEAAALQADLADAAGDPDHELADVVTFTLEAGRAEFVFARDESKGFVFLGVGDDTRCNSALLEALVGSGREICSDLLFEDVLAEFLRD